MSFRKVLFFGVVLVFGVAGTAHAQVGVYGMVTGQRFGSVNCPTYASPCASNDGAVKPYGGTFGAYYDFKDYGPVRLGFDLRGDVLTTNKRADSSAGGTGIVRDYDVLAGVRGTLKVPIKWLHPYAEIAGGYSRNNTAGQYTLTTTSTATLISFNPAVYSDYALFKGFVGVDVSIFPFMDLRAIELGEGEAFGSAATANNVSATGAVTQGSGPSTHGTQSIGAGLVFHMPR